MDLRSELKDVHQLCLYVSFFGHAEYQDDLLWSYLVDLVQRTQETMTCQALADVIGGLGQVGRGSDELWRKLLDCVEARGFEATLDNQITILRGVVLRGYEDEQWLQQVRGEVLSERSLKAVSSQTLILACC